MKEDLPLISIVVPVYNVEKYLSRCIESILSQTYTNIELILVDDGSKDKSGKICDEFVQRDNRVFAYHQKNQGAAAARNFGIKESHGEFIQFVDSDDWIDHEMTKTLYESMVEAKVELVICGYTKYKGENINPVLPKQGKKNFQGFSEDMTYWLIDPIIGSPCNKLFNKRVLIDNNISYPVGVSYAEDYYFNLQYYKYVNSFLCINQSYYNYFLDTENSLHKISYNDCDKTWNFSKVLIENIESLVHYHNIRDTKLIQTIYSYFFTYNSVQRIKNFSKREYFDWLATVTSENADFIPEFYSFPIYPRLNLARKFISNMYHRKFMNLNFLLVRLLYSI